MISLPTKDICSLCHALANQHRYNLSHDLLVCKETDEVRDNKEAGDSIAADPDNSLVCDQPDWDSDDENSSQTNVQNNNRHQLMYMFQLEFQRLKQGGRCCCKLHGMLRVFVVSAVFIRVS